MNYDHNKNSNIISQIEKALILYKIIFTYPFGINKIPHYTLLYDRISHKYELILES